jgi:hypothetical protein
MKNRHHMYNEIIDMLFIKYEELEKETEKFIKEEQQKNMIRIRNLLAEM